MAIPSSLGTVKNLVETLNEQIAEFEVKPTKALSLRIRNNINTIQKLAVSVKADLRQADAAGYKE